MKGLNDRQREAVETLEGPLLVIAGAGSGKTRVLTHRVANLLLQKKAKPHEVLAVTFTNKAAREMRERVERLLNISASQLWMSTFHSACVRILRSDIEVLGYAPEFVIYDDADQAGAIKHCLRQLNWDSLQLHPRAVASHINRAKNLGLSPTQYQNRSLSSFEEKIFKIFERYQQELKRANAVDFGDLLSLTVQLFKENPKILKRYQEQFRYCMVDEYQDTNHVQYLLIKYLCGEHQNICVVGDEDQSIYSWRGADISNILSFEKDFPNAKVIKLEQNYRSTKNIIQATSTLISNNKDRKPKHLFTHNEEGEKVHLVKLEDEYHEARFVVGELMRFKEEGVFQLRDAAIFYRTHAQSRVLEDILRQNDIPHQIYGGIRFYGRAEIKDVLAYFKLILNQKDAVSFLRVVNTPVRGIGKVSIDKMTSISHEQGISLFEASKQILNRGELKAFIELIERLSKKQEKLSLQELYHELLDQTGYGAALKKEDSIEAQTRLENLEELDSALHEYERRNPEGSLETYLEEISLVSDLDELDETDDFVKLMTFHSAKGLEFPVVFMVGCEEGLFPHSQSDWDPTELEEERRLCYVGMTRAKKLLCLTHANARRVRGILQLNIHSRFLDELPREFVTEIDLRRRVKKQITKPMHEDRLFDQDGNFSETSPLDDFNQESEGPSFRSGTRVEHPTFGRGVVCRVEGQDESTKLTIKFDSGNIKKFMATQTPLQVL